MMPTILFWLYLVNLTLLILHEMDSAYWKEWDLFRLPGGIAGFLIVHFPVYLAGLYGLVLIAQGARAGLIFSLALGAAGILAFGIHAYFLWQGRSEFNAVISKLILWVWMGLSALQIAVTVALVSG